MPIAELLPLLILLTAFAIYCWWHIAHQESVNHLPKWAWAIVCIVTGLVRQDSGTVDITPAIGRPAYCSDTPTFERWLTASEVLDQSAALARRRSTESNATMARA